MGLFLTAAALTGVAIHKSSGPITYNMMAITDEFDRHSVGSALKNLHAFNQVKGKEERILLTITSPGGEVIAGKELIIEMESGLPVDTYVPVSAASMGAETMITGERRYAEPDAVLLFHGAHGGSYLVTQHILGKILAILKSEEFKNNIRHSMTQAKPQKTATEHSEQVLIKMLEKFKASSDAKKLDALELPYYGIAAGLVAEKTYDVAVMEIESRYEMLKAINEASLEKWDKVIAQSNGKLTKDIIREKVYANFTKDMVFTGRELFDMGILTGLGRPPKENYVSQ